MRKLLTLLLLLGSTLAQAQITAGDIKSVTVFQGMAQIQRVVKVSLTEGDQVISIGPLPQTLIENSMEVKAAPGIEITQVNFANIVVSKQAHPDWVTAFKDSLQLLTERLKEIRSDRESLQLQRELLVANKNIGGSTQGVKADELEDVLSVFQRKMNEFKAEGIQLDRKEAWMREAVQSLQIQLNEYEGNSQVQNRKLMLSVRTNHAQPETTLELVYLVTNVSWTPSYDIRVKDTHSPVEFVLKAAVTQQTGENWNHVHLKISGANPALGGVKPELQPYYVEKQQPRYSYLQKSNKGSFAPAAEGSYAADWAADSIAVISSANSDKYSSTNQTFLNIDFDVTQPANIKCNGENHLVELTRFTENGVYGLQTVPKYCPDVFATVNIAANDILSQLNGNASIYLNGTYTGDTWITFAANDSLLLTLGKDRRMQVKRDKVKSMSSKKFMGSTRKESNTYEITLLNAGTEAQEVVIEDQIPLSNNSDITVTLTDGGNAQYNAESGKLVWTVKIEPKQSIKVRFSFEVSYPDKIKIEPY